MTGMLASVTDLAEAQLALQAGADIIDLKNPVEGALGALPLGTVRGIVHALDKQRPVSATVGDLPMEPRTLRRAVHAMAATGVDYVKIGFFQGGDWTRTLDSLAQLAQNGSRLIAVLFGDQRPDLSYLRLLADAGFTGAMLDTLDKQRGSLPQVCDPGYLRDFVGLTRAYGLLCGLAGSLHTQDIPTLLALDPDYLGFRGALCRQHQRTAELNLDAARSLRTLIPRD